MADLYGGLARLGIDSERADRMELWQIGAAFGMHRPEAEKKDEPQGPTSPPDWEKASAGSRMAEHRKTCSGCPLCRGDV